MIQLIVGNSVSRLVGLSRHQLRELRLRMLFRHRTGQMIKQPVKDSKGRFTRDLKTKQLIIKIVPEILKKHLMDQGGRFPTGLLYIAEAFLTQTNCTFEYLDTRDRPLTRPVGTPSMFREGSCPEPYPEQIAAAQAAVTMDRGIIVAPTGLGKSLIAALICDAFQVRTLIVVPKLSLKHQLTESLREFFGERSVGPLVSGQAKHWVTVENVDALRRKRPAGIDLVLVDEFHHAGAASYRKLNATSWDQTYFKLGLTATPFRSKQAERILLESVLSKVIYKISYRDAVDKGYIVPIEAYYYDLPTKRTKAHSFAGVYRDLVSENEYRNLLVAHIACKLVSQQASTLILTKLVGHGEMLEQLIEIAGHKVPFAEGKKGTINQSLIADFNSGVVSGLLGTTGIVGEGTDTKRCEYVILAGLGRSKPAFMQQVGRVVRRFPGKDSGKVILFRDESHAWTLAHFEAQAAYLKQEYGVIPVQLDLPF